MNAKTSLKLGIANVVMMALLVILGFLSPLGRRPGPIHPLMVPFFIWALLSWIPTLGGLVLGIVALCRKEPGGRAVAGIALNGSYLVGFVLFVVTMWPYWMGI